VFHNKEGIRKYVAWAIPRPRDDTNEEGQALWREEQPFPYMYKFDGEAQMDSANPVSQVCRSRHTMTYVYHNVTDIETTFPT
jgi:hypothetical protein